jgi:hypothetical protein
VKTYDITLTVSKEVIIRNVEAASPEDAENIAEQMLDEDGDTAFDAGEMEVIDTEVLPSES